MPSRFPDPFRPGPWLLAFVLSAGPLQADRVETRDGAVHHGRLRSAGAASCVLEAAGETRFFPRSELRRIDLDPTGRGSGAASVRRRELTGSSDPTWTGPSSPRERRFVQDHPGGKAWVLRERMEHVLGEGGRRVLRLTRRVLLGERPGDWAGVGLTYGSSESRPRLLWARRIDGAGRGHELHAGRQQDGAVQQGQSARRGRRRWRLDFPGLRAGDVLCLCVEVEGRGHASGWDFAPAHWFGRDVPVLEELFVVTLPGARKLRYLSRRMGGLGTPEIVEGDGLRRHVWRVDEQKALPDEKDRPASTEVLPFVRCTLLEHWGQVCSFMGPRLEANLRPGPAVRALARSLGRDGDDRARCRRAFDWVRANVRYHSAAEAGDFAGAPAELTLQRGAGDCVDQCVLLSSILACLDVPSRPLAVCTRGYRGFDPEIPTLHAANHYLLRVELGEGALYLDPTDRDHPFPWLPPDCQGVVCLDERTGIFHRTPVFPADANLLAHRLELVLDDEGRLSGRFRLEGRGAPEARFRRALRGLGPTRRRRWVEAWLSARLPGARLERLDVDDPADVSRPLVLEGRLLFPRPLGAEETASSRPLRLPALSSVPTASLARRESPVAFDSTMTLVDRLELRLPRGTTARLSRPGIAARCEGARVQGRLTRADGLVRLDLLYEREARELDPAGAEKLRLLLDERDRFLRQVLVLVRERRAGA